MTCIVALVQEDKMYMACDSLGCADQFKQVRKDKKIFKIGEFLVGYTWSFRMGQLIRYAWTPPEFKEGQDIFEYMVVNVVTSLRNCFKEGGFTRLEEGSEKGGVFLIGFKGRIFKIEADFQVGEVDENYNACGSGQELALASLNTSYLMSQYIKPSDRLLYALKSASKYNTYVGGTFYIEVMDIDARSN